MASKKGKIDLSIIKKKRVDESKNAKSKAGGNGGDGPDYPIDGFPLELDQIDFFEYNPREADNPNFEDIKSSIQEVGLQQPLVVTKRSGDTKFTLFYGGNTRLKILRELYAETKDEKYYNLKVNYRPFTTISNVIANHMSENENRGDMLFVDKAKGASDFKKFYEQEHGVELSSHKLAQALKNSGWRVSQALVALYLYTTEYLADSIPETLKSGMGKHKVEQLRRYITAIKIYAKFVGEEVISEEAALSEWYDELSASDDPDLFNHEAVFSRFCYRIATETKQSLAEVEAQMQHILSEGKPYTGETKYIEVTKSESVEQEAITKSEADHQETISKTEPASTGSHETVADSHGAISNAETEHQKSSSKSETEHQESLSKPEPVRNSPALPLLDFVRLIHKYIDNPLFEDLIIKTDQKPFFTVNENRTIRMKMPQTMKRFDRHELSLYVFYRFIKIWSVYHLYITGEYSTHDMNDKGLYGVISRFATFILAENFINHCPKTKKKPAYINLFDDTGFTKVMDDFNQIDACIDQYLG